MSAWLGIFAMLLQAILFGWHHHPLKFATHEAIAVTAAPTGGSHLPAAGADDCDICAVLHHHSAAPITAAVLPLPPISAARVHSFVLALFARSPAHGFEARAPPRA